MKRSGRETSFRRKKYLMNGQRMFHNAPWRLRLFPKLAFNGWAITRIVFAGVLITSAAFAMGDLHSVNELSVLPILVSSLLKVACATIVLIGNGTRANLLGIAMLLGFLFYGAYSLWAGSECNCFGEHTRSELVIVLDVTLLACFLKYRQRAFLPTKYQLGEYIVSAAVVLCAVPMLRDFSGSEVRGNEIWTEEYLVGRNMSDLLPSDFISRCDRYSGTLYILDARCQKCQLLLEQLIEAKQHCLALLVLDDSRCELLALNGEGVVRETGEWRSGTIPVFTPPLRLSVANGTVVPDKSLSMDEIES